MLLSRIFIVLILSLVSSGNPDWIIGEWEGKGTLFGRPAWFHMNWQSEWGKFYSLEFKNGIEGSETPTISSSAFYRPNEDGSKLTGYWFDSRGVVLPIDASADLENWISFWGNDTTERGKTHYRLVSDTEIEVTDYVLKDTTYNVFAKALYNKVK